MSENTTRRQDETAIDRLLADSGFAQGSDIREELLELRSLAATPPLPSDAVRALMVGEANTALPVTEANTALPVTEPLPVEALSTQAPFKDELAARRRKRRAAIAGLAVAVSLAGGATAAAAQEGGIPGTFHQFGAAIGSVVSQFVPVPANTPPHGQPTVPAQSPSHGVHPAPTAPNTTDSAGGAKPAPGSTPGTDHAAPGQAPAAEVPQAPASPGKAGNVPAPAPGITPPSLGTPDLPPSLGPSTLPVPVPTHVIPEAPKAPSNPSK